MNKFLDFLKSISALSDRIYLFVCLFVFNILGWFQKILNSRAPDKHEGKELKTSSASSSFHPSLSPHTPNLHSQSQSVLGSKLRWSKKYDVLVCHSSVVSDSEEAARLASFLEASPRSLRCFLQHRDECPGGATSTELCQAVQESHLWALLITPSFLQDDWCHYMMHQALAEGTMSSRIIPLLLNLSHSQYPQELRFFCCIDLTRNPDRGYRRISDTVFLCEYKIFTCLSGRVENTHIDISYGYFFFLYMTNTL